MEIEICTHRNLGQGTAVTGLDSTLQMITLRHGAEQQNIMIANCASRRADWRYAYLPYRRLLLEAVTLGVTVICFEEKTRQVSLCRAFVSISRAFERVDGKSSRTRRRGRKALLREAASHHHRHRPLVVARAEKTHQAGHLTVVDDIVTTPFT